MYCEKCGCRIKDGETRCSNCGQEVTAIEYCGGFWGLVGEEEKIAANKNIEALGEREAPMEFGGKKNEKHNKRIPILLCLFLGLLAICAAQTARISLASKQYKSLEKQYGDLEKENNNFDIQNINLAKKNNSLEEDNKSIKEENEQLIKENEELEEDYEILERKYKKLSRQQKKNFR